jgi:hypothetical protein
MQISEVWLDDPNETGNTEGRRKNKHTKQLQNGNKEENISNPNQFPSKMGIGGSFPRVKRTTHLQLVPRSRKCGSIHPLPHTSSWCNALLVKHRDNFTLPVPFILLYLDLRQGNRFCSPHACDAILIFQSNVSKQ